MTIIKTATVLFLIAFSSYFLGWLALYKLGANEFLIQSADAVPSTYTPISVLKNGTFTLNEYYDYFREKWPDGDDKKAKPYYLAYTKNGDIISYFPPMNAVLALPVYLPVCFLGVKANSFLIPVFGRIAASLYTALSAVFVYLAALKISKSVRKSILVYFSYAFGTIAFALSSQSMWQHSFSQAMLALSSCIMIYGMSSKKLIKYAGLTLSLATLVRPTGLIFAVPFAIFVFIKFREEFVKFTLLALVPLTFQFWYNYTYFGGIFKLAYESQQFTNWTGKYPEGFFGLWLSPSKGLLTYSPIFLFSLLGVFIVWFDKSYEFNKSYRTYFRLTSILCFLFTAVMGRWVHWYGGWGFGYRMAVDMTPFLILLLIPVTQSKVWQKLKYVYFPLLFWSVLVEIFGLVFDFRHWHTLYDNGPIDTGWLWSIKDSEMAYYFRRLMLKFR